LLTFAKGKSSNMTDELSADNNAPSMGFRLFRFVLVICVAIAIAFFLWALRPKTQKKQIVKTPPSVRVVEVFPVSKVMTVEAYGTVKPRRQVNVAFEVPGKIDYVHPSFQEGGQVGKGEVLARVDQESYRLDRSASLVRIEQARADMDSLLQDIENLKNDRVLSAANLKLAQKELDRIKTLVNSKVASQNSLDKTEQQTLQSKIALQGIENRLTSADKLMALKKSALEMARVDFQRADLALKKTEVRSDFDGFVLAKYMELGEYVNPGQIIGAIYQKEDLDVDIRIPLERLRWIETVFENGQMPGAKVAVANYEGSGQFVWDAKVVRIMANVDEKTRTLPMTLEIMKSGAKPADIFDLKPGTFVKCTILGETVNEVFVLPRHMLKQNDTVFTVSDGKLDIKQVSVFRKYEENVYVNAGLEPGDQVITSPLPGARQGMALTIKENGN
jgi:RND family efflux transporter MFP subunit